MVERLHRERYGCHCPINAFDDVWHSLDDAKAQFTDDVDKVIPGGRYDTPEMRGGQATTSGMIATLFCACSPGVRLHADRTGAFTAALEHAAGCSRITMPLDLSEHRA